MFRSHDGMRVKRSKYSRTPSMTEHRTYVSNCQQVHSHSRRMGNFHFYFQPLGLRSISGSVLRFASAVFRKRSINMFCQICSPQRPFTIKIKTIIITISWSVHIHRLECEPKTGFCGTILNPKPYALNFFPSAISFF